MSQSACPMESKLLPPLLRALERDLLLWVSPHTALSKQVCNSAHKSRALSFISGSRVEPDSLISLCSFFAQKHVKVSKGPAKHSALPFPSAALFPWTHPGAIIRVWCSHFPPSPSSQLLSTKMLPAPPEPLTPQPWRLLTLLPSLKSLVALEICPLRSWLPLFPGGPLCFPVCPVSQLE